MTIQKVTAFALVEQQQRWGLVIHRIECEMAELGTIPTWQRDQERMAELTLDREKAFDCLRYWNAGVLRWIHTPAEA